MSITFPNISLPQLNVMYEVVSNHALRVIVPCLYERNHMSEKVMKININC